MSGANPLERSVMRQPTLAENTMTEDQLIEATAQTMREKIAQSVERNPRKVALEFADRIRHEISTVTPEQVQAFAKHHNLPGAV